DTSDSDGLNTICSEGTQAGKTTLLNCLSATIPPNERMITVEEVFELRVPLPDVVSLQTRQPSLEGTGEVRLRRLVKEALRMRPDRIIVGEVRQEECLDLSNARTCTTGFPRARRQGRPTHHRTGRTSLRGQHRDASAMRLVSH